MKKIIAVLLLFCILGCSCQSTEESRVNKTPEEKLQLALDDIFKGDAYDLTIEIDYSIIDGNKKTEYDTHIRKNTVDGVPKIHLQRIDKDGKTSDEYYIGTSYCSADGKLLNPNYKFTLKSETMLSDFTMKTFGDYTYVDGEDYKTYKFTVPQDMLATLMDKDSGMTATEAEGSVILGLDGYPKGYRIKAKTRSWIGENAFYDYNMRITVTVNYVGKNTPDVVIPFEPAV